ncbi:MAG: biotin/lipoyl-containing protein [Planctomycetota bacterium]
MKLRKEFVRGGQAVAVSAERLDGDRCRVRVGDRTFELAAIALPDGGIRIADGDRVVTAYAAAAGKQFMVRVDGRTRLLAVPTGRGRGGAGASDGTIRAPMTGTVLEVACKPGDTVAADQTLVVLSAMKMEHKLDAGVAGVVTAVQAKAGTTVDQGAELVVVEPIAPAKGEGS